MSGGTYLLEAYLPKQRAAAVRETAVRARLAADQMRREGTSIRFLRSYFLPEDETYLGLYEAQSIDDVAEASRRAGVGFNRIQPAVQAHERRG